MNMTTATELEDCVPKTRLERDTWDSNVLKNELDGVLQIIDRSLRGLTPRVGTARELSDDGLKACQFGLEIADFVLKRANALLVGHANASDKGANARHQRRRAFRRRLHALVSQWALECACYGMAMYSA